MHIFVLFGITGDLARKRIIPALVEIEKQNKVTARSSSQLAIGVGRKPQAPAEFSQLKKRLYLSGELNAASTFKKLKKEIYAQITAAGALTEHAVIVYSSLPPRMHLLLAQLFSKHAVDAKLNKKFNVQLRFLFEKPIGTDLASAMHDLAGLHAAIDPVGSMHFVDHYLFKEPLRTLQASVAMHPALFKDLLGSPDIAEMESIMYETDDVATRGSFYDAVGALNDVGQNHLLQLLAEGLRMRDFILSPSKDMAKMRTRTQIINSLKIVNNPIFGQYKGYLATEGVKPNSKTETFFRVEALYASPYGKEIKCIISAGKSLGLKKSGLLLIQREKKENAAKKSDKDKNKAVENDTADTEIFIDMAKGKKDAYLNMFERAMQGNAEAFAQESEIIAGWKFTKRAKQIKTRKNIVYESWHDIIEE